MMMYPGLSKVKQNKQPTDSYPHFGMNNRRMLREHYAAGRIVPLQDDLPPVPSIQMRSVPRKPVAGSEGPPQPVAGPSQRPPEAESAAPPPPGPPKPAPVIVKGPSADQVSELEAIAYKFSSSDINIPKIIAEATIFLGIVLLNWATQLKKPQRSAAIVKFLLLILLLVLHPVYTAILIAGTCLTYAYVKLAYRTPLHRNASSGAPKNEG